MTNTLRVLGGSAQNHEVVLLERHRWRLRLKCSAPIAPGTLARLMLEGESLLGEVIASEARNGYFEVVMKWIGLDSRESVMGSLLAMNAYLTFHEEQRQARDAVRHNIKKSS